MPIPAWALPTHGHGHPWRTIGAFTAAGWGANIAVSNGGQDLRLPARRKKRTVH